MTWIAQARKRNQTLGTIPYDNSSGVPKRLDLRNSGYLSGLRYYQTLSGTYGTAAATATDQFGAIGGYISRFTVLSNSVGLLYDTSGEMNTLITAIDRDYARYGTMQHFGNVPVSPITTLAAYPSSFALAAGINTWGNNVFTSPAAASTNPFNDQWSGYIPIALEFDNKSTPLGFFQTALNSQETAIEMRFRPVNGPTTLGNPGTGVYYPAATSTGPTPTGNVKFQQIYFDPIADPASQPPLGYIHQWREWQQALTADGDTDIILPPSNYYLRIILMFVTGAANAMTLDPLHLTRLRWQYGANLAPWDEDLQAVFTRMEEDYTFSFPPGCYVIDFIKDSRTERDVINAAATTNLRVTPTLSGATYSGGAYVKVAVEQLIPLTVPAAGQAGVQGAAA